MRGVSTGEVLRVDGLTVRYGQRVALTDIDLVVPRGVTVAVIGPNGSGKSSLLAAIAGLVPAVSGRIEVDRRRTALVLQSTDVDRSLPITVADTVRMGRYPHRGILGRFGDDDRRAVEDAMARTNVAALAGRQLHELSGGQRQRVLVAQGLAQQADLLLLDEPASGLDVVSRDVILEVIDAERRAGRSVVMTTHSLDDAARCDVVMLLAQRMVAIGAPREVLSDDHLCAAFRGQIVRLPSGPLLLEDSAHRG